MAGRQKSGAVWRQLVAEMERGSLTQEQFAIEHGVNLRTLGNWAYRLRRERRGLAARPRTARVRFIPVRVRTDTAVAVPGSTTTAGHAIDASVGNVRLHFAAGIECDYVGRLLAALSQHCAC